MSDENFQGIAVICTVRDVEKTVKRDVIRLCQALGFFSRQLWIVAESDSSDNTLAELEKLSKRFEDFHYFSLGNLSKTISERTIRIAKSRNRALKKLAEYPQSKYQYVMLADLDGRNCDISESAIKSCFDFSDWDMCAANQVGPYYDIWGLRHKVWNPNDCWNSYYELEKLIGEGNARQVAIVSKMIRIHPTLDAIEVQSAYGGLALYKREVMENQWYSESLNNGTEVCDHVDLNLHLSSLGHRLFINPKMINKISFPKLRMFVLTPRIALNWFASALSHKIRVFLSRM